jgi:hypothetical protein
VAAVVVADVRVVVSVISYTIFDMGYLLVWRGWQCDTSKLPRFFKLSVVLLPPD